MYEKLRRLSYNQLVILGCFLSSVKQNVKVLNLQDLEKKSGLKGKSLGGVLSGLTRTKFRNISLIEPLGKAREGHGLRWQLNDRVLDINKARKQVNNLLESYD